MPHVFVSLQLASRFLSLRNMFQGLAHWILALRNLRAISSNFIPALPPPPPFPTLDAPTVFSSLPNDFFLPSVSSVSALPAASAVSVASAELIAIESQPSFLSSPISAFQSSLMLATPNQLPISIFILLSIISASLFFFSASLYFHNNTANISSAFTRTSRIFAKLFRTNPIPYLVPAYVPPIFAPLQLVICLISLLVLRTGLVRVHSSSHSHVALLTGFLAHVPVVFHLDLDHVDSYQ